MTKVVKEITLGTLLTVGVTIATTVGAITVAFKDWEADVTITLREHGEKIHALEAMTHIRDTVYVAPARRYYLH